MEKKYKVGDRIFYECYDGSVNTSIVIDIKDRSYTTDRGKEIPYQWLVFWRDDNYSSGIESYNCLSPNNPKCKSLAQQFARFDKKKDEVIDSIIEIMSPWESKIQLEIIDTLKLKYIFSHGKNTF